MPLDSPRKAAYNDAECIGHVGDEDVHTPEHSTPAPAALSGPHLTDRLVAFCVIDASGTIVAADGVLYDWLGERIASVDQFETRLEALIAAPGLARLLQLVLAGQSSAEIPATLSVEFDPDARVVVRLRSLFGPTPLALVAIHRLPPVGAATTLDALTGLPDRRAISARAEAWRSEAAPATPRFAVLFLDLDDFKRVNDAYSHAGGDAVLQTLAARWLGCVREGDLVARYGGDEFVFLIRDATTAHEVDPIIRRVREATRKPVTIGGATLQIDATLGWSTPADDNWTIEGLLAAADRDMYARKGPVLRYSHDG